MKKYSYLAFSIFVSYSGQRPESLFHGSVSAICVCDGYLYIPAKQQLQDSLGEYTGISLSVHVCVCVSVYRILVIFVMKASYSVAGNVLNICRYIYHVLKFDKMQVSNIYSLWFKPHPGGSVVSVSDS